GQLGICEEEVRQRLGRTQTVVQDALTAEGLVPAKNQISRLNQVARESVERLVRQVSRRINNEDEAPDVVQEAFKRVTQAIYRGKRIRHLMRYLNISIVSASKDHLRGLYGRGKKDGNGEWSSTRPRREGGDSRLEGIIDKHDDMGEKDAED